MKRAQLISLLVFGAFAMIGFMAIGSRKNNPPPVDPFKNIVVKVWGTVDEEFFKALRADIDTVADRVSYTSFREEEFDQALLEALARGEGPDAILVSHERLVRHLDKVQPLSFESLTERTYRDTFVEGSEYYISPSGIYAVPLMADPLVLFWNRDVLTETGFTRPPEFWDELPTYVSRITEKDEFLDIGRSAIAFGEYENVENAKEIISALLFQSGMPITLGNLENGQSILDDTRGFTIPPTVASVRFYTEYADPQKTTYTWNGSLPSSRQAFLSGDLAMYIGFASEAREMERANPNLNFDIAVLPQIRDGGQKRTFSRFIGFSVMKRAPNIHPIFVTLFNYVGNTSEFVFGVSGNAPVRKDSLEERQIDPVGDIAYQSTVISRAWIDPAPEETDGIFKDMIEDVSTGRKTISQAVIDAHERLIIEFKK